MNTDILDDFAVVDPKRSTEMQNVPQWLYRDMIGHLTVDLGTRLSRLFGQTLQKEDVLSFYLFLGHRSESKMSVDVVQDEYPSNSRCPSKDDDRMTRRAF